jgi:hypothetical protein
LDAVRENISTCGHNRDLTYALQEKIHSGNHICYSITPAAKDAPEIRAMPGFHAGVDHQELYLVAR